MTPRCLMNVFQSIIANIVEREFGMIGRVLIALVFWLVSKMAWGVDVQQNLTVTVNVVATCTLATSTFTFTNYDTTSPTDKTQSSNSITTNCTSGTPYHIGIDAGANSADVLTRKMKKVSSTELLNYFLYRDSGYSLNWGNDLSGNTNTLAGTGTGVAVTIPVYGKITAAQVVPTGTYTDTVVVTLRY
jgi:spore coat protein U-like protein